MGDGHFQLMRPSQQMRQMLGGGAYDFRADKQARALLCIHAHFALIDQHHAAAALIVERHFADGHAFHVFITRFHLGKTHADGGDLRAGKHHADGAAAQTLADIRISACIFAGDFALIARFVQQRQLVGCIACDKDMCNAGLHGEAVGFGHAALIKLDAQVFQAEFVHIGAAADGGEHIFGGEHTTFAAFLPVHFDIALGIKFHFALGIQIHGELFAKHFLGFFQHHRIGNAAQKAAQAENVHFNTQAVQGLADFQANHARAEHGHAFGQSIP